LKKKQKTLPASSGASPSRHYFSVANRHPTPSTTKTALTRQQKNPTGQHQQYSVYGKSENMGLNSNKHQAHTNCNFTKIMTKQIMFPSDFHKQNNFLVKAPPWLGKLAMATLPQSLGGRLLVLQLAFPL